MTPPSCTCCWSSCRPAEAAVPALRPCRPDLVAFVNGLPLVVMELKKPGVPARAAYDENLTSYKHPKNGIP